MRADPTHPRRSEQSPPVLEVEAVLNDDIGVFIDAVLVERRLQQAACPYPRS